MTDLLIAIALDFSGERTLSSEAGRIAQAMALGRAGDVRWSAGDCAVMFARDRQPASTSRVKRGTFPPAPDGGSTLFAGRLFERDWLRSQLGKIDPAGGDAALYAAAHIRWGEDCDRRVTGNYAAIRWFPAQRRLRISRSPTSDCPIHLWRQGSVLVAASIPRALFAAGAPDTLSDDALADWLLLTGPAARDSIYASCTRVPAATVYQIDRDGERSREYWSIADVPPVHFKRDEEYVDAVDEQFRRAVGESLTDIRKPALSLSGGLDSQAVAAYALEVLAPDARLATFTSIPMPGWTPPPRSWKFGDESEHVRALVAMYPQIDPTFVTAADSRFGERSEARSLLGSWPPFNETNAHWGDECAARAAAAGCDALLCGDLGNTGFSYDGLTGFPNWLARGRWLRLLRELRASDDRRSLWRKLASLAVWPHVPISIRRWRDRDNPWRPSPFATWTPLREDFAHRTGALDRARGAEADFDGYDSASSRQWRDSVWRSMMNGGPEIALGYQLLHGIAAPDPTSFVPLLELTAGIPDEQYLRDGVDRWLARRMLTGKVPEMVRTERREGLQAADWPLRFARERDGLMAEMARMQGDQRLAAMFDFDRMQRDLAAWDGTDTVAARHFARIHACIGRGVSTARFVRYVEGRNVG